MVNPQQDRLAVAFCAGKAGSPASRFLDVSTPLSRTGGSPLSDEAIWKRLREAGFDEDSIKRRDKAALIAYIAKLEAEIFEYQHHMGLLILERKEWASKCDQVKASADSAEITYKYDQAAHSSALAEARKREEGLRKALGVEKECIASIEKALHELRAESAEAKVAADSKMAEAQNMIENAQKKFTEAEVKLHAAESLQAEASRSHRAAERKLQEVEAREDELRRRLISFKSECDAKEKELILERQSLYERQKVLLQGQERLVDGQALLNEREEYISGKSQKLNQLEKELEASKTKVEKDLRALEEEKSNLDMKIASLSMREAAVIKRESLLNKKEQELLILQEKSITKENDEIQRLTAEHETALKTRKSEFEAELNVKLKMLEDEMEARRKALELREVDINERAESILVREHELEVQSAALMDKERDVTERLNSLDKKEQSLSTTEKKAELEKLNLQKEREDINNMKLELKKSMDSLEDKRKQVEQAQEKLEDLRSEKYELSVLEKKLKEEIDSIRAQKLENMAEADDLKSEKAKFEAEWELIEEKREELRKEEERIAEERKAITKVLKEERVSLKLEKDALRDQFKQDVESLSREREAFISKMEHEHSEWFSKIQKERTDLLLDMDMQARELENCVDRRREEIESYLREREEAFEREKNKELQYINSLKETVTKELEHIALEMKRLDKERIEINLDRERREKEWDEIRNSIEELQIQSEKLKKQRELLHADREEILVQIQNLKNLEDFKIASENILFSQMLQADLKPRGEIIADIDHSEKIQDVELNLKPAKKVVGSGSGNGVGLLSKQTSDCTTAPSSTPFSWIKRCTELIFKPSPEKLPIKYGGKSLRYKTEDANLKSPASCENDKKVVSGHLEGVEDTSGVFMQQLSVGNNKTNRKFIRTIPLRSALEEPKEILEVPVVGVDVKESHNLGLETMKDVAEQGLQFGRKRSKSSSPYDDVDGQLKKRQNNKKRKQHKDLSEMPYEEAVNCVVSTEIIQPLAPKVDHELIPVDCSPDDAEETSGFIDKSQLVPEVMIENKENNNSAYQANVVSSQDPSLVALEQGNSKAGGSNEHVNHVPGENGVSSFNSKAQDQRQDTFMLENHGQKHNYQEKSKRTDKLPMVMNRSEIPTPTENLVGS